MSKTPLADALQNALNYARSLELRIAELERLLTIANDALAYAIWQHNGGGTPMHNHWNGVAQNAMNEIATDRAQRKEVGDDL